MAVDDGDPFDLERFVHAQAGSPHLGSHAVALAEIRAGGKRTHWMWYVFPQAEGLGHSDMARRYAIGSDAEARAFLGHPLLGERYRASVAALQALPADVTAEAMFGSIDALKLRSSLALFARVSGDPLLAQAVRRWGAAD